MSTIRVFSSRFMIFIENNQSCASYYEIAGYTEEKFIKKRTWMICELINFHNCKRYHYYPNMVLI